jgi:hypothetical protein
MLWYVYSAGLVRFQVVDMGSAIASTRQNWGENTVAVRANESYKQQPLLAHAYALFPFNAVALFRFTISCFKPESPDVDSNGPAVNRFAAEVSTLCELVVLCQCNMKEPFVYTALSSIVARCHGRF